MAANLQEVLISGRTFPNVLALPKSAQIGDLQVETTIEESHTDVLEITEHPIEDGAAITDHSYSRPTEVILRCGWSNASIKALVGIVTGLFSQHATMSNSDYISGVYSQLLRLQQSRQPFALTTGMRHYDNMLIRSLTASKDRTTAQVLMVEVVCREVFLVSTRSATLPAKEDQANPRATAEVEAAGTQQVRTGLPAPGGSVPVNEWGPP